MNKKKIAVKVKKKFSFNICNDVSEETCKLVFPTLFHIVKKSARQIIVPTMSKCYTSAYYEDNFEIYSMCKGNKFEAHVDFDSSVVFAFATNSSVQRNCKQK